MSRRTSHRSPNWSAVALAPLFLRQDAPLEIGVWFFLSALIHSAAMNFSLTRFALRGGLSVLLVGAGVLRAATPDSADYRKYAPDREIDILHLTLDVTPDFKQRTVAGSAVRRAICP